MGSMRTLTRNAETDPRYVDRSDEELVGLIFREEDRLPMSFAREVISRGGRLASALAEVARDPRQWERMDAGWCSAIHACFLLGAIGGPVGALALLDAFRVSDDAGSDWLDDDWPSIFGRLGPSVLGSLQEAALDRARDCYFRHRAMKSMAAVALRHPEHDGAVFSFITRVAGDQEEDRETRVWAGDVLLDFARREHEPLLLSLAEGGSAYGLYTAANVRDAMARGKPNLEWDQRDWLDFYSEDEIAERQKRWDRERLTEEEAWKHAFPRDPVRDLTETKKEAAECLRGLLPLADRVEKGMRVDSAALSKPEIEAQHALAMELHRAIGGDRSRAGLFDSYTDHRLWDWLVPLPLNLAAKGLMEESSRLSAAWAQVAQADNFLSARAYILARAGRGAEAREQAARNLALFPRDPWIHIKAGDAMHALKDLPEVEARYRAGLALAERSYDREGALERLIPLLEESGRTEEAEALKADHRQEEAMPVFHGPYIRPSPKVSRNDPCPCGSGRKYKKCCLNKSPS